MWNTIIINIYHILFCFKTIHFYPYFLRVIDNRIYCTTHTRIIYSLRRCKTLACIPKNSTKNNYNSVFIRTYKVYNINESSIPFFYTRGMNLIKVGLLDLVMIIRGFPFRHIIPCSNYTRLSSFRHPLRIHSWGRYTRVYTFGIPSLSTRASIVLT